MSRRPPPKERFAEQFERAGDDDCWNWKNCKSSLGYGRFFLNGKSRIASRVAYEFANGPIDGDLCVLHNCDNPSCVNPQHLRLGTLADNTADILRRGRWPKPAKVTPEIAAEIKSQLLSKTKLHREIAQQFGLSRSHVSSLAQTLLQEGRS